MKSYWFTPVSECKKRGGVIKHKIRTDTETVSSDTFLWASRKVGDKNKWPHSKDIWCRSLRTIILVCTKSFGWIQWVLHVFSLGNNELERNSTLKLHGVKCFVHFLTTENNSRAKIHRLWAANGEENVMNLKNIQRWQLMFQEGRTNIRDGEHIDERRRHAFHRKLARQQ